MTSFIGHFHPVLVHLPIGILLLGVGFDLCAAYPRFRSWQAFIRPVYMIGAGTAILACATGYLLSLDGGYDEDILNRHRWLGIATAIVSILRGCSDRLPRWIIGYPRMRVLSAWVIFALVGVSGHFGGTLTHGSGYLWRDFPEWVSSNKSDTAPDAQAGFINISDVQEARVYPDLVAKVIGEKCVSCHGMMKQKGGLRLDGSSFLLQGGEHGKVMVSGDPAASEIYRRTTLPLSHDDHMPPEGKPSLTAAETALLEWWIRHGHDFKKKVKELPQAEKEKIWLYAFEAGKRSQPSLANVGMPAKEVAPASIEKLQRLRSLGVVFVPMDPTRNYLRANLQQVTRPTDSVVTLLSDIQEQLVAMDFSATGLSDEGCIVLAKFQQLRRLNVSGCPISDAGLSSLAKLPALAYLNLSGTVVTGKGLESLHSQSSLQQLYLFGSKVAPGDVVLLRRMLPGLRIDTGGYRLPLLEGDTSEIPDPPKGG